MKRLRARAVVVGLVLPFLYGCEQVEAPTELSIQRETTLMATFGGMQNDAVGWGLGTYFADVPEIMSAAGIYRQDRRKRRLVWEIIGFRQDAASNCVVCKLEVPITVTVRDQANKLVGRYTISEVGFDHGAIGAAGIDLRSVTTPMRSGYTVTMTQDQSELTTPTKFGDDTLLFEGEFE